MALHRRMLSDSLASRDLKSSLHRGWTTVESPGAAPPMAALLDATLPATGISEALFEAFLLSSLLETMCDVACPEFSSETPCLTQTVPQTPTLYISALNLIVKARKDAFNSRKSAKFWKQCACRSYATNGEDAPLTPSPSNISETGLREELPPARIEKMKELMRARCLKAWDTDLFSETRPSEVDGFSSFEEKLSEEASDETRSPSDSEVSDTSTAGDSSFNLSLARISDENTLCEDLTSVIISDPDKTTVLADRKADVAKDGAVAATETSTRAPGSSLTKPRPLKASSPRTQSKNTKTQTSPLQRRASKTPFTSVQKKRAMFESLTLATTTAKTPVQSPAVKPNGSTSMLPVSSARKQSGSYTSAAAVRNDSRFPSRAECLVNGPSQNKNKNI